MATLVTPRTRLRSRELGCDGGRLCIYQHTWLNFLDCTVHTFDL